MSDFDSEDEEELELRRQLQEIENKKVELSAEDLLLEKLRKEHENTKFWAPVLLLFPLGPVIVAITTVVFGGVTINIASMECNAHLGIFLKGAVAFSYILLVFYSYCWLSPRPIKSLRTLKIFYSVYGVLCFAWWGVFGTWQATIATNVGLDNCLQKSPALYIMSGYEIGMFWILMSFFLCWAFQEIGKIILEKQRTANLANRAKQLELEKKMTEEARVAAAEEERLQAELDEEERIRLDQEERDRLYASSDEEGNNNGDAAARGEAEGDDSANELDDDEDEESDSDDNDDDNSEDEDSADSEGD